MTDVNKDHEIDFAIWQVAESYFIEDDPNICWPWLGGCDSRGTPRFKKNKIYYKARRVILLHHLGLKQSDLWILTKPECKLQTECCNWNHMFLGNPKQSTALLIDSQRHDSLNRKGEKHPMHILTEEQVLNIRTEYAEGMSYTELSHKYEVAYVLIIKIINRELWNHI